MVGSTQKGRFRSWLWLIRLIGVIVPRRLRADWRQEWEAELRHREAMLEEWDQLDWRNKLDLIRRSTSAFWDALWLQQLRLEDDMFQDFRYGARMLWRHPGFTLVAVGTLALGIGANTAIFSIVNALLLSPPRMVEAERLAVIWRTPRDKAIEGYASYLDLQDWQAQSRSFAAIAAYKPNGFTLLTDGEAERILGMRVTTNFLSLLQIKLRRGRDFQVPEEKRGAEPVVILGHSLWQTRFGGSEAALGQQLFLNGRSFTIIGVLPPDFEFPLATGNTGLLTTIAGEEGNLEQRGAQVLMPLGRLQPDATLAQAQAEMAAIMDSLAQRFPQYNRDVTARVVSVSDQIVGRDLRRVLWLLLGAVGFVLLIACTNVANLQLARAVARQKELALRVALGANTWRIARQMLTETVLLSLLAGGGGLLLTVWGLKAIRAYNARQLPRLDEVQINGRVLVFTFAVAVLTALLCSLLPILRTARQDLNESLKAGAKTATGHASARLWRYALVVSEVALGLVLLVGAGLMIRSFGLLVNVHPGFDPNNVLMGRISLTGRSYQRTEERVRYVHQTLAQLKALPGAETAAFAAPLPFSGDNVSSDFRIEGHPEPDPGKAPEASNRSVTSEYFQAMRIPLRRGRYFTEQDQRGAIGVAIINEALASRYFPQEDPLGQYIKNLGANQNDGDPERWQIVGVVGDVHHSSLTRSATPEIYLPFQQNSWSWGSFFVRTTNDPVPLLPSFTDTIRSSDKAVPLRGVQPLTQAISNTVAQSRFYMLLFALFGATGLVLTLTGIYSVMSYTVAQHTQEIGVRMALGAHAKDVLMLVLGRGLLLSAIGIGIGAGAAAGLTRLMEDLLFGIDPIDPLTYAAIIVLFVFVALLACWLPARRATKVDPMIALRHE